MVLINGPDSSGITAGLARFCGLVECIAMALNLIWALLTSSPRRCLRTLEYTTALFIFLTAIHGTPFANRIAGSNNPIYEYPDEVTSRRATRTAPMTAVTLEAAFTLMRLHRTDGRQ